jgi:hypothetical protein
MVRRLKPSRPATSGASALRRLLTFLAFPPAGLLAVETVGAVAWSAWLPATGVVLLAEALAP